MSFRGVGGNNIIHEQRARGIQLIECCDACAAMRTYGFMWALGGEHSTEDVVRQICLECIYDAALFNAAVNKNFADK
jgi:hypothetical protein